MEITVVCEQYEEVLPQKKWKFQLIQKIMIITILFLSFQKWMTQEEPTKEI